MSVFSDLMNKHSNDKQNYTNDSMARFNAKKELPVVLVTPEFDKANHYTSDEFKVQVTSMQDIVQALSKAATWYLDTETYATDLNETQYKEQALIEHIASNKKVTKGTYAKIDRHFLKERKQRALNTLTNTVRLIQINTTKETILFDTHVDDVTSIWDMYKTKLIVGHNLKFDIKSIFTSFGVKPTHVFDTMLAFILYNYATTPVRVSATLQNLIEVYQGVSIVKDEQSSDFGGHLSQEQLDYSVIDVKYLPKLHKQLKESTDATIVKLENNVMLSIVDIELAGIPINKKALLQRANDLEVQFIENEKVLSAIKLNPRSPKQVKAYMLKQGINLPKTDRATLLRHLDIPLVKEILLSKKLSKEVKALRGYVKDSVEGRLYANFNQLGANTGRMSSSKPNVQQIPRSAKEIFYKVNEDKCILKADYPAIELRLASVIMNDYTMLQAFRNNEDLHRKTASFINHIPQEEVTKELRQQAKAVNFGFLYGMSASTFKEYAFVSYGVEVTQREAEYIRDAYFTMYKGVKQFHQDNSSSLRQSKYLTNVTLYGRKARVNKFTTANNSRVQGSGADMLKLAILKLHSLIKKHNMEDDIKIISLIHDEIIIEASLEHKTLAGNLLQEAMNYAVAVLITEFSTKVELEEVEKTLTNNQ